MSIGELTNLANTVLGKVSTNLSKTEILYLISQAASYEIEETKGWPFEVADYQPADVWYGVPKNLEMQVTSLHQFLFDKEEYVPSTSVKSISDAIIKKTGIK